MIFCCIFFLFNKSVYSDVMANATNVYLHNEFLMWFHLMSFWYLSFSTMCAFLRSQKQSGFGRPFYGQDYFKNFFQRNGSRSNSCELTKECYSWRKNTEIFLWMVKGHQTKEEKKIHLCETNSIWNRVWTKLLLASNKQTKMQIN